MCFCLHPSHPYVKVATSPIKCYKVLVKDNRSPYRHWLYRKNERVRAKLVTEYLPGDNFGRVEAGLHTFSSKVKALGCTAEMRKVEGIKAVEMFIPAGAEYYHNPDREEYVSDRLLTGNLQPIS